MTVIHILDIIHFFNVGPLKEDIFSGHLISPIFQSTLHITITSLCLCVGTVRFSCLLINHAPITHTFGPSESTQSLFSHELRTVSPQAGFDPPFEQTASSTE